MFYYLYEIKNLVNNKIYVGVHKTRDMNDGYMGSGKVIRSAIDKHGITNFTKVILEQFDDSVAMYAREKEVVTDEFLARSDVYNLRRGGTGGFDYINKNGLSNSKIPGYNAMISGFKRKDLWTKETFEKVQLAQRAGASANMKRMHSTRRVEMLAYADHARKSALSEASKNKRKKTFVEIGHSQGEKNSQYGSVWITDGTANRKIKKIEAIPLGWKKGRIITGH